MIAIIGAMKEEVNIFLDNLENTKQINLKGFSIYTGKYNNKDILLTECGVGKVNAAMISTFIIGKYDIELLIFSGVSGSLSKNVNIGDVVVGTEFLQYDFDVTEFGYEIGQIPKIKDYSFTVNKNIIDKLKLIKFSKKIFFGKILTADKFVSDKKEKEHLGTKYKGLCVDMESASVAQVCQKFQLDFIIVRSISDSLTDNSKMEFKEFVDIAASNSRDIVLKIVENY